MSINIPEPILIQIQDHGEACYPEEGAGLLLGEEIDGDRRVVAILPLENIREDDARRNRYLISAEDMLRGERAADRRGLSIVGIFHSHPDHPSFPSEYDREWAIPWYSYLITSVQNGQAETSRSWRLTDDRTAFTEEQIIIHD
jgi:proteasome lid subunit RPN8/RPN11